MCNVPQDLMNKMAQTVRQFLDEGRMFTGYDVTIETRTREKINMKHSDVREGVHEIEDLRDALDYGWDAPSGQTARWAKSQVNMPGGQWAFVYHPDHLDPKNYTPRQGGQPAPQRGSIQSVAAPAVPSISALDGSTSDSGGDQGDGTFAVDYRNRLLVPTRFLEQADLSPGDTVYVVPDSTNKCVLLVKDTSGLATDGVRITTQRVERNGDLRLSSTTLKTAELKDSKFVIETTDVGAASKVKAVSVKEK